MAFEWIWQEKLPSGDKKDDLRRFHEHDDCNQSPLAHHHTLGNREFQAAPGNHKHLDGLILRGSRKDGTALKNLLALLETELGLIDETTD